MLDQSCSSSRSTVRTLDVVIHAGRYYVVLRGDHPCGVLGAAVARRAAPFHRSDVRVDGLDDLAAMALPGGEWIVKLDRLHQMHISVRVGRCLAGFGRAVLAALRTENAVRLSEDQEMRNLAFDDWANENAPLLNPGCRQVVARPGCE